MYDPHLVPRAARGDVVAALVLLAVNESERPVTVGRVDHRQKHHVAFVALEVSGVSADDPAQFVLACVEVLSQKGVDLLRLRLGEETDHTHGQSCVLWQLSRGDYKRSDVQGLD